MRLFFRFLVISMFLSGSIVACSGGSSTCTKNDECTNDGETCCIPSGESSGTCKKSSECAKACSGSKCQGDDDCSNNQTCKEGCCEDKGTTCTSTKCQEASDCTNAQVCQNNCCVDKGTDKCSKPDDCPNGQECIGAAGSGVCQACAKTCDSSLDCSGSGISCYRGCCRVPPCKADGDCTNDATKSRCNAETGQCVACTKNEHCQELSTICNVATSTCKKVECTDDADCPSNKPVCNKEVYRCEEEPVCKEDADCTDPQLSRCDPKADGGKGACKRGACTPCTSDDECGPDSDYCVATSQGLKDGRKCLRGCTENGDCPNGFDCEEKVNGKAIIGAGIKVCFPRIQYCQNPCDSKKCDPNTEFCNLEKGGICELKPAPCKPCQDETACNEPGKSGNQCLNLGGKKYCGQACSSDADCPKDQKSGSGSTREFKCVGGQCTALDGCQ